jgi:hypothetical protein
MTTEQVKKLKFSLVNLFLDTQKEIVRVQQMFKGFSAAIAGTTWFAADANAAMYVCIAGIVIDVVLSCLRIE